MTEFDEDFCADLPIELKRMDDRCEFLHGSHVIVKVANQWQ